MLKQMQVPNYLSEQPGAVVAVIIDVKLRRADNRIRTIGSELLAAYRLPAEICKCF